MSINLSTPIHLIEVWRPQMRLVCEREWRGVDLVEARDGVVQSTDRIRQRGPRGWTKDVEAVPPGDRDKGSGDF